MISNILNLNRISVQDFVTKETNMAAILNFKMIIVLWILIESNKHH